MQFYHEEKMKISQRKIRKGNSELASGYNEKKCTVVPVTNIRINYLRF
jgi:hypothetical protein